MACRIDAVLPCVEVQPCAAGDVAPLTGGTPPLTGTLWDGKQRLHRACDSVCAACARSYLDKREEGTQRPTEPGARGAQTRTQPTRAHTIYRAFKLPACGERMEERCGVRRFSA